ncbi:sulfite exporter TauE/SafE family protein [Pseudomonas sp. EpS/L25]|uniref:sulfite exporter TauE/SafE family protein n=1 Tax=Pseudomonas sp. EpS/L25 TaxID=1749078 RepID=UPI000A4FB4AC|nr:sulfite exporter TauE/SafE family protein [Pseudomonas sp. EpS/L25]
MHDPISITILLFLLGMVTGFIGTNTGGSAFLTVPVMMWLGISPQSAIASARVASVGTMIGGIRQFHKQKKVDYFLAIPASVLGLIGAICGALLLTQLSAPTVQRIIGAFTLIMVGLSIFKLKKEVSAAAGSPSAMKRLLGYLLFIGIGMVGGLFGGQAKLATYVYIIFFDKSISDSVGTRKVSGLVISLASLAVYGISQVVNWWFGMSLFFGTLIGSSFGSKYALRKGDVWMERLFNGVVIVLALRLLVAPPAF